MSKPITSHNERQLTGRGGGYPFAGENGAYALTKLNAGDCPAAYATLEGSSWRTCT